MSDRTIIELDEAESLKLISPGGIGRIAYQSRFGPAVLPVNYKWHDGAVVFRTAPHSALDEDLQTGIAGGDGHRRFVAGATSACVRSTASSRAARSFCAAASQAACRAAARSTLSCSVSRSALTSRFRMPTASRPDRATNSSTWRRL